MATRLSVTNDIAALGVAQEEGVAIGRFATADQLQALREARGSHPAIAGQPAQLGRSKKNAIRKVRPPSKNVFVVHGRNDAIRRAMFDFLRAIGLNPLDWSTAMRATRTAAPYVGQILEKAFEKAAAVVVLLTPDDEARLKREFWARNEDAHEKKLMGQARPNVLFESGMAFGSHPRATVLVEVGKCRPFSDTYGRHVVRLDNSAPKRSELAEKLEAAGCPVQRADRGWLEAGNFEPK
jgi:predicted nucleotide-binding protein